MGLLDIAPFLNSTLLFTKSLYCVNLLLNLVNTKIHYVWTCNVPFFQFLKNGKVYFLYSQAPDSVTIVFLFALWIIREAKCWYNSFFFKCFLQAQGFGFVFFGTCRSSLLLRTPTALVWVFKAAVTTGDDRLGQTIDMGETQDNKIE